MEMVPECVIPQRNAINYANKTRAVNILHISQKIGTAGSKLDLLVDEQLEALRQDRGCQDLALMVCFHNFFSNYMISIL